MIEFGKEHGNLIYAPFLVKAEENDNNCVRFIVSLAREGEKGSNISDMGIKGLEKILRKATPIYPAENEVYEIMFEQYILYQTRNESYCSYDDYEIRQGKYFIVFKKSRLLDSLPAITDCQISSDGVAYPGEWVHYGIYCQNHIIDIISHNKPIIRKLKSKNC